MYLLKLILTIYYKDKNIYYYYYFSFHFDFQFKKIQRAVSIDSQLNGIATLHVN